MRRVSTLLALLVPLALAVGACAADPAGDQGAAPAPTATTAPEPTTAPPSTAAPKTTRQRPAPRGVAAPADRRPAPDLRVTAFDGRTVTLGAFRGTPVVVNFFESW
jgi:cytochrome oxidase Cu insertion factor (SCO1/SenC/PrrC family)